MAATLQGEALELAYGEFTERFRHVMTLNYFNKIVETYDPNNQSLMIQTLLRLERIFETRYQEVTEKFYKSYRVSETGDFAPVEMTKSVAPQAMIVTNIMIHGFHAIKKKEQQLGIPFQQFNEIDKIQSVNRLAQTMVYNTLDAPRQNIIQTMKADPLCARWLRKADTGACNFCMMLVSRGAVYTAKTSRFESHGNCGCSAVPVYKGYKIPDESLKAADKWMADNKGLETKARRAEHNKADVEAGLKKEVITESTDKLGRTVKRTTYEDTVKGKQVKQAEKNKALEKLDSLKRNGDDYKVVQMSDFKRRDTKSQVNNTLADMRVLMAA